MRFADIEVMYDHPSESNPVRVRLLADHRRLNDLLARMVCAVEINGWEELESLWTQFESTLLRRMEAEEDYLVPALLRSHPVEGRKLQDDHRLLRKRLIDLETEVDLHLVRLETTLTLAATLYARALYEQRLYHWAAAELRDPERASLLAAITDTMLAIAHPHRGPATRH